MEQTVVRTKQAQAPQQRPPSVAISPPGQSIIRAPAQQVSQQVRPQQQQQQQYSHQQQQQMQKQKVLDDHQLVTKKRIRAEMVEGDLNRDRFFKCPQ